MSTCIGTVVGFGVVVVVIVVGVGIRVRNGMFIVCWVEIDSFVSTRITGV